MEPETGPKQERYLGEMTLRRGGKHPVYTKVRFYPTSEENDPRSFVVKDLNGNEIELDLKEQLLAEVIVLGKPTADTMDIINAQSPLSSFRKRSSSK